MLGRMIGVVLGQYRITGAIGQGGMGAVYVGEHMLLQRPAAIKVLLPELSQNQDIVARFFNEARAATAIRHPGIVEIYDFGYHVDGSAYIAMEYLQGESLAARMARGRMAPTTVLAIARQLAGALSAAHAKGIVHRDLKPDNVFLVPDPEVPGGERIKLLDFGIAKLAVDQQGQGHTRTGAVMGTPTYMAPEQCRGVAVDHRADLYSIGCIIFEACTGRPPFVGEGSGDVLAAHIYMPPPTIASIIGSAPAEVETLVQRLLIKNPAHRVQSAQELIHAIDVANGNAHRTGPGTAVSYGTGSAGFSPPTTLSGASRVNTVAPSSRSRGGLFAALGAIAVAGVVIAILAHNAVSSEPAPVKPMIASAETIAPVPPPPPQVVVAAPQRVVTTPPVTPPTIEVTIDSKPVGAEIVLDNVVLGKTPYHGTLPRKDGLIALIVRLAGYTETKIDARADMPITQSVKLEKLRIRVAPHPSRDDSVNPFGN
jgi:serine/threonine protein kinase